ncbi:MAG: stage III sporulation protein AF [Anaerovoracaceae bacterium]|nr:stage III sporulation protein AF [Anaerovoracaceae bacterium]
MDIVKDWICNMFIMILSLSFMEMLLPDTSISKYIKFIFSLVIMAAVIYPLAGFIVEY